MPLGGKPEPVYVVTDAQIASGEFTIAPGKCIAVAALDVSGAGVSGGSAIPVYVVDAAEANRRGVYGGLNGSPVVDATAFRSDYGLQQAIPVYVVSGTLGDEGGGPTPSPSLAGSPIGPWLWLLYNDAAPTPVLELSQDAKDALVSWWNMNNITVANDEAGHQNANDSGTITPYFSAIAADAVELNATNAQFTADDGGTTYMGSDADFTLAFWYQTLGADTNIAGVSDWVEDTRSSTIVFIQNDTGVPELRMIDSGGSEVGSAVYAGSALAHDTWHLCIAHYNKATGEIGIQIDNGTIYTDTVSGTPYEGAYAYLNIGTDYGWVYQGDGRYDEVAWFSGIVLGTDDRNALWNYGNGASYDEAHGNAAPTWVPTDAAAIVNWWDFTDPSSMFTDDGTTPVSSDGDLVYRVNDKANGQHLYQTTAGLRPVYRPNQFGENDALQWDDSDDALVATITNTGTSWYLFMVGYLDGVGTGNRAIIDGSSCTWYYSQTDGKIYFSAGGTVQSQTMPTWAISKLSLLELRHFSSSGFFTIDGDFVHSGTVGSNAVGTTLTVGNNESNEPFNGYVCEAFVMNNPAASVITNLYRYVRNKYGIGTI